MQVRLRLNDQIAATVRQHAGQRRVHLHDHLRHLVERGLLVDVIALSRVAQEKQIVIPTSLAEAIFETRSLLRSLVAVRDQQTVSRAQVEAKREAERYLGKGGSHANSEA